MEETIFKNKSTVSFKVTTVHSVCVHECYGKIKYVFTNFHFTYIIKIQHINLGSLCPSDAEGTTTLR